MGKLVRFKIRIFDTHLIYGDDQVTIIFLPMKVQFLRGLLPSNILNLQKIKVKVNKLMCVYVGLLI